MSKNQERKFKHENRERLCYCCDTLQDTKDKIKIYTFKNRSYGSIFDGWSDMQLCDNCKKLIKDEWINEKPKMLNEYTEEYIYEEELDNFISKFHPDNKKYIYNSEENIDEKVLEFINAYMIHNIDTALTKEQQSC